MRWLLMVGLVLAACKKKVVEPTGPEPPRSIQHPDLQCQSGTIGAGNPPPAGLMVYCAIWKPDGSLTKHGPAIEWHTPSRRKSKGEFLEGVMTGSWVVWHATGSPAEQGNYVAGSKDGTWESFHSDGTPAAMGDYIGGKEHGKWTYYSEDGKTRTDAQWVEGRREGTWLVYKIDDPEPLRERVYANGRLISQRVLRLE